MLLRINSDELLAAVNAFDGFRMRRVLPSDLLVAIQSSHRNMYLQEIAHCVLIGCAKRIKEDIFSEVFT